MHVKMSECLANEWFLIQEKELSNRWKIWFFFHFRDISKVFIIYLRSDSRRGNSDFIIFIRFPWRFIILWNPTFNKPWHIVLNFWQIYRKLQQWKWSTKFIKINFFFKWTQITSLPLIWMGILVAIVFSFIIYHVFHLHWPNNSIWRNIDLRYVVWQFHRKIKIPTLVPAYNRANLTDAWFYKKINSSFKYQICIGNNLSIDSQLQALWFIHKWTCKKH